MLWIIESSVAILFVYFLGISIYIFSMSEEINIILLSTLILFMSFINVI
jgi:hypothetical protein